MRNAIVYPGSGNIWGKLASGIGILALSGFMFAVGRKWGKTEAVEEVAEDSDEEGDGGGDDDGHASPNASPLG